MQHTIPPTSESTSASRPADHCPDNVVPLPTGDTGIHLQSRHMFDRLLGWIDSEEAGKLPHDELEALLCVERQRLFRQVLQEHLELRARREVRQERVVDEAGVEHKRMEKGRARGLMTMFGWVSVERLTYREPGRSDLHPADAVLNLPPQLHSYGLARLAVEESIRGSFEDSAAAMLRSTQQKVGKRQIEEMVMAAASDFERFYSSERVAPMMGEDSVLVLSSDGKGVVMRTEDLRGATAKKAAQSSPKLASRLSKGEKSNRKRMATVGSVYEVEPVPRSPGEVMAGHDRDQDRQAPKARNKWLTVSVEQSTAEVMARIFDEAERRDPQHLRSWVMLVDGNNHQLECVHAEAERRDVKIAVVLDVVHVLEYLWSAAWCFYKEGDPAAETWVRNKALEILAGKATLVAAAIRRKATFHQLDPEQRRKAEVCANYLVSKRRYLDYKTALASGWPIATGIIEGACRHLVRDRMELTGVRWRLRGAEAILRLRALHSNRELDAYWQFHLRQQLDRVHLSHYAPNSLAMAA